MARRTGLVGCVLGAFLLAATAASALEFDISPNRDGTFDVFLGQRWSYTPNLFSEIQASYRNTTDQDETDTSFVGTFGKILSVGVDVLGLETKAGPFRGGIALNAKWDRMDIREIGYVDSAGTRFFVLNDRVLNLILPRLKGDASLNAGALTFSAGGEFAPWLWVRLDQKLTISPGLQKTPYSSAQSATLAFSANARVRVKTSLVSPEVSAEYEHLGIAYGVYTAGGPLVVDVLMQNLKADAMLVLGFLNLGGIVPTVGVEYEWGWAIDRSAGGPPTLGTNVKLRFGFEL